MDHRHNHPLACHDVHIARAPRPDYGPCDGPAMPELPKGVQATSALVALRRLFAGARLDPTRWNTADWNPLGPWIRPGASVLVKPNWVYHENESGAGLDCLVTHVSLLEALLHYVVKAKPGRVVVGDAPIQGCDFQALKAAHGLDELIRRFQGGETAVSLADLRRTVLCGPKSWSRRHAACRPMESYALFDLGGQSALEPITAHDTPFRVTMYDPEALRRTHGPGKHQYLIAREALDADLVISVPKLKTHRKAGMTGALKNLVGTNGHKEYLPHHRKGGSAGCGDCYPGDSRLKRCAEAFLDRSNASRWAAARFLYGQAAAMAIRLSRRLGAGGDVEGSWHGNDTVWRTCLDVQRILHYGRPDGTMADRPQREILHLTDAMIAGEGEGPLAPEPVPLGLLTLGRSAAAVDWVHARLMSLEPAQIPLIREAFSPHAYRLADFPPDEIHVVVDGSPVTLAELTACCGCAFRLPRGWRGHCESARQSSGGHVRC